MKRDSVFNVLSSVLVIIAGLLIGFIILLFSNAQNAGPAFWTILTFGSSSLRNIGDVLFNATPIIFTGLSVAFAYRTGLFNIGATGQYTFGSFVAIFIGVKAGYVGTDMEILWNIPGTIYVWSGYSSIAGYGTYVFLAPGLRIITSIVAAAIAGALWGAIPGILKAYRNVHEVITSIMTNYIAMFLVAHLITSHIFNQGQGRSLPVAPGSNLPSMGLGVLFSDGGRTSNINIGIILAILAAIVVYIILEKTTFGFELKACGFNREAAKYVGINEKKNIVSSMMICGALAGLGGAMNFLNDFGRTMTATHDLLQEGFTGISVAFLGLNHPIGIIFSGAFVAYIFAGGDRIQHFGFTVELVQMVIAVIIYFCAFVILVKSMLGKFGGKLGGKSSKEKEVTIEADASLDEETGAGVPPDDDHEGLEAEPPQLLEEPEERSE